MKKVIVLVLILVIPAIVFYINDADYSLRDLAGLKITKPDKSRMYNSYRFLKNDSINVSKKLKNIEPKWEYIKNNLFNPDFDHKRGYYAERFNGPILIELYKATKQDSLAFNKVIKELREVITNVPIAYFSDFTGENYEDFKKEDKDKQKGKYSYDEIISSTLKIKMNFIKRRKNVSSNDRFNLFNRNSRRIGWVNDNKFRTLDFSIYKNVSFEEREQCIQYQLLNSLCKTFFYFSGVGFTKYSPEENIFNWHNKNPLNRKFTELDKFLLKKLYADDFEEQFKSYMYKAYSWRYASFFINAGFAKLRAFIVVFLIGILTFVLSFSFFQNKIFKKTYLNYFIPCLFIAIYLANLIIIYLYITNMELSRYLQHLLGNYMIAVVLTLIYSSLLWGIEKLIIKKVFSFSYQLTLKLGITFLVFNLPLIICYMIYKFFYPEFLLRNLHEIEPYYLSVFIAFTGLTLGRGILIYLNHFSESLVKQKDVELSRLKEMNTQSELKLLQSHINPHFLYNALNSIAGLAHDDADKTEKMALSLSDLFRYSINKKGEKMSPVDEEVTMVQNYLEIEKIRFGNRLTFLLDIDETILNKNIPMYILQPLVENAIKHGVSKIGGAAKISLEIIKEQEGLLIIVSDNGPDFPKGLVSGHGLQTVNDLLRLSYGEKASLKWENTPEKKITITIIQTD